MKFGLCHLVVLDDGTPFKEVFIAMRQALNLNYDIFAKWNHKGLSVEHFHCFLNTSVTIAAEERGTTNIFSLLALRLDTFRIIHRLTAQIYFAVFQPLVEKLSFHSILI